jgi:hypothetical protein
MVLRLSATEEVRHQVSLCKELAPISYEHQERQKSN